MEIVHTEEATRGRYTITIDGETAEMTYSRAEPVWIVDHTSVPDALRGQGLGGKLAKRLVDDARKGGHRLIGLCPFFAAQVERHPEWHDLIDS